MKIDELLSLQTMYNVPYEQMYKGEGYGYKSSLDWDEMDNDEIIYIPTDAYMIAPSGLPRTHIDKIEDAFTKQSFIDLCDGDEQKAKQIFELADGAYPDDVLYEFDDDNEYQFMVDCELRTKDELCIGIQYITPRKAIESVQCNVEDLMSTIKALQSKQCIIFKTYFDTKPGKLIKKGTIIDE